MPDYTPETLRENERMDRGQPCPHCGQDLRLPPDAFEQFATSQQRMEALERAIVMLYDDVSDHLLDDVLALVTECRASLSGAKEG